LILLSFQNKDYNVLRFGAVHDFPTFICRFLVVAGGNQKSAVEQSYD
jgi:hypothetical protein